MRSQSLASPAANTGVSRASRARRSPASAACTTLRHSSGCRGSRIGDARQERHVGRVEVGQQQVDELVAQGAALRRHRRDLGLRVAARGHHRQRELQAQRPALGQLVQACRGVAVDARCRSARAPARSSRRAGSAAAPDRRRCNCRRPPGRRSRAGSRRARPPPRAGWTARCAAGRPAPRACPRAGDRPRRRSARCPAPICATSASQTVTPSRPAGVAASSSVWPKVGRPAPMRTASARPCTKRGTSSCGCADSHATTRPCARCSRRHCASSEVLPKPAGACTRITGWSRSRSWSDCRRGRATWWRGTRGGVTFSSRSSGAPAGLRGGGVATVFQERRIGRRRRIRPALRRHCRRTW